MCLIVFLKIVFVRSVDIFATHCEQHKIYIWRDSNLGNACRLLVEIFTQEFKNPPSTKKISKIFKCS